MKGEFSTMYNFANDWRMKHIEADLCSLLRYHSASFYRVMGLFPRKGIHYKIFTMCNRNVTLALKCMANKHLEPYNSMTDTSIQLK